MTAPVHPHPDPPPPRGEHGPPPRRTGRWLQPPPPDQARRLLFGFPYPGQGASWYHGWPRTIGDLCVVPLQPPGRQNRLREPACRSHAEFARQLVEAMAPHLTRPFAFIGHCGATPFALQTVFELQDRGLPLPERVFASSWGGPQRGIYGTFMDLTDEQLRERIEELFHQFGMQTNPEVTDIALEVLRTDREVQRTYRYDASQRVPSPVVALRWTRDDEVPPDEVVGWEECADVSYVTLEGDHFAYLRCPPALLETITAHWPPG